MAKKARQQTKQNAFPINTPTDIPEDLQCEALLAIEHQQFIAMLVRMFKGLDQIKEALAGLDEQELWKFAAELVHDGEEKGYIYHLHTMTVSIPFPIAEPPNDPRIN